MSKSNTFDCLSTSPYQLRIGDSCRYHTSGNQNEKFRLSYSPQIPRLTSILSNTNRLKRVMSHMLFCLKLQSSLGYIPSIGSNHLDQHDSFKPSRPSYEEESLVFGYVQLDILKSDAASTDIILRYIEKSEHSANGVVSHQHFHHKYYRSFVALITVALGI